MAESVVRRNLAKVEDAALPGTVGKFNVTDPAVPSGTEAEADSLLSNTPLPLKSIQPIRVAAEPVVLVTLTLIPGVSPPENDRSATLTPSSSSIVPSLSSALAVASC